LKANCGRFWVVGGFALMQFLIVKFNPVIGSEYGARLNKQPSSSLGVKDHFLQGGYMSNFI
jgi:hypothetical protein